MTHPSIIINIVVIIADILRVVALHKVGSRGNSTEDPSWRCSWSCGSYCGGGGGRASAFRLLLLWAWAGSGGGCSNGGGGRS